MKVCTLVSILSLLIGITTNLEAEKSSAQFEIESVRIVILPTKETGDCWDACAAATKKGDQDLTKKMEDQARDFREAGTQEAESKIGAKFPTPAEVEAYWNIATTIFVDVTGTTHLPEIFLKIRSGSVLQYPKVEQDRCWAVFSDPQRVRLAKSAQLRYLMVDVYDQDLSRDDRIGFKKILVGQKIFDEGGSVIVRFDRVHYLELSLRKLDE